MPMSAETLYMYMYVHPANIKIYWASCKIEMEIKMRIDLYEK